MLAEQAGDVQARSSVGTARKSRGKARHEEDLRAAPSSRTRTPAGPPHGTVKNVVEVAPSQGQQQTSDRDTEQGQGRPGSPPQLSRRRAAERDAVLAGAQGTGARSCSGPCQGHRSKERKSYGRRSQAEAGQNRRSVAESGGIRDRFRVHAQPPSQHPGSQERSRTGSAKTFLAEWKCRRQVRDVELGRCRQQ